MRSILALYLMLCSISISVGAEQQDSFSIRAGVRFLTPESAEVIWESSLAGESSIAYGPTRKLGTIVRSEATANYHRVQLSDLEPGRMYFYRIGSKHEGKLRFSPIYELDGRMNYAMPTVDDDQERGPSFEAVIRSMKQPGGYAIILGSDAATEWSRPLASNSQMSVVAACENPELVQDLRQSWYADGVYGIRLSAQLVDHVPKQIANLVICHAKSLELATEFLSPSGTLVLLEKPPNTADWTWQAHDQTFWTGQRKSEPKLTDWGHQYGSAANGSYVGENLNGIDDTSELSVRWLGRPGADFGIDRNPRMPAPLAVGGRLFHQGMNRMIALDAFNGSVLWSLEIPDLRRVNIPRDCSNWCADREFVFAATRDCVWRIDAATGKMVETVRMPENERKDSDWGYVGVTDDSIIGTAVKAGSAYEAYWSKGAWYDGQGSSATAKVCGKAIFSIDKKYGTVRWSRPVDAVVQSTIAITQDHMYFVEVKDEEVANKSAGKLKNEEIWPNASVVCLDLKSGEEVWTQKVPEQAKNQVIAFGIANDEQFVFESSSKNEFHFVSLDAKTGEQQWAQSTKWPSDNHGAHMQHAVLMNGKIFVQPTVLDATTGEILKTDTLGKRRGCATPVGAGQSVIYRGGGGPVSLWSLEKEKRSEFTRLRPSCWLSTIPAQGMLFSPEAGGGCSCGGWMECSIGFAPASKGGGS